jgi:CRISPR-associated protein (TIGR02710 family)
VPRALIVPVGGTPEAPRRAIEEVDPTHVAFLVSGQTRSEIDRIEEALARPVPWKRVIETPDSQDLAATYREVAARLPGILDEWRIGWDDVTVDLTGGTKTMVAALVMATALCGRRYLYIGGDARDRGGTGVPVTGRERARQSLNPWDQFGTERLRRAAWAFNRLQFSAARAVADEAEKLVARERREYVKALGRMIDGFSAWDRFEYGTARSLIRGALDRLSAEWASAPGYRELPAKLAASLRALDDLTAARRAEAPSGVLLRDLLSNAARRGGIEGRFDDATARLYRFVEGLAQMALWDAFGIRTAAVPMEQLQGLAGHDIGKPGPEGTFRVGLQRAYDLLLAKGHPLGMVAADLQPGRSLANLLQVRNQSLLAHGLEPVRERTFKDLFHECLRLAAWSPDELTTFPTLPEL